MAQKSRFKMAQDGNTRVRKAFPHLPGSEVKNPKFIQTAQGNKLLIDGWWAYARKPNYTADMVQSFTWAVCAGFVTPITFYYPVFFLAVLLHRTGRDFERCVMTSVTYISCIN
jgi:delta24(24(1))-sterol reductase